MKDMTAAEANARLGADNIAEGLLANSCLSDGQASTVIDATLDFRPEHLPPEALAAYFKKALIDSEFALLTARNNYQAQLASHKALLDQRDRLMKPNPPATA